MTLSRRRFLNSSAATAAGTVAGVTLVGNTEAFATASPAVAGVRPLDGYGPLIDDPAGLLALPRGFHYTIVTHAGRTRLESGQPTPDSHDGTATFLRRHGGTVLVNNHEIDSEEPTEFTVPHLDGLVYDPGAPGGCTVVEVDRQGRRLREYVGVAGTSTNCAGGRTPWHTWLTCEETDTREGEHGQQRDHGYVFEVDPHAQRRNADPQPIKALGRFEHEAAVVDPWLGHIYQTEDAKGPNGLFYRYTPPRSALPLGHGSLCRLGATDGVLEAMSAYDTSGDHVADLSYATRIGTEYQVRWVRVPDRDAREKPIREQFGASDVTRARKLEGMWWAEGGCYLVASYARDESPGVPHDGQVWFYDPRRRSLTLKVRFGVNRDPAADGDYDGPDNITFSPYGGLIIAEDGGGIQHLIGATARGRTYALARNMINVGSAAEPEYGEFAGPTFSPDARILFASVQEPGIMFAIHGRWWNSRG